MRKILVLRGGALGDFLVTLPALALLRQRWPASRIELVGNVTAAELGRHEGLVDVVHSQHDARWAAFYDHTEMPETLAHWLAEFDLVLNYWPDPDNELRPKFPQHAGQIFLSAEAHPTQAPAAKHYCAPLAELGLNTHAYFHLLEMGRSKKAALSSAPIAIHAGSGSAAKNWPLEHWEELCAWLKATYHTELLIVSGLADAMAADRLSRYGRPAHQLPLLELAALLAKCRLFVGHDSGVGHLAAACGAPCVLLFGPTDPAMWAPPSSQVRIVRRGTTMASIALAEVQAAVSAAISDRM